MRRLVGLIALGAALTAAASAAAAFQPIERRHGEVEISRVRAGTITVPPAHRRGRITVILTLADPPLAAYSRTLAGRSSAQRLNTKSVAARAYVAKLARAQRAAAATLKRAIPTATVERNYTLLLNGMAVEVPVTQLAKAAKLSFTHKLYPSYRYNLALNRSPGLMGADTLIARGRRLRRGNQDRGRRRRRRPRQPLLRLDRASATRPAFRKAARSGRRRR